MVTISSFGILGTYVAFALIASVLYLLSRLPNILNLTVRAAGPGPRLRLAATQPRAPAAAAQDCLALGVIFAATDSVAVLQVGMSRPGRRLALRVSQRPPLQWPARTLGLTGRRRRS